ncbi:hypothetical protein A2U01_0043279 [Trifolium medium]|uniref:Secreted protein n=1 Tax=Trifolium medium TaxID=97028 RepID=A0A392QD74_9FABA|nr:hypothetical protein [Trifolium medium]
MLQVAAPRAALCCCACFFSVSCAARRVDLRRVQLCLDCAWFVPSSCATRSLVLRRVQQCGVDQLT